MAEFTDHFFFEVRLIGPDGTELPATRHWTVQDAMADAASHPGASGGIWYHGERGSDPVQTLSYGPDGSIEVTPAIPGDA